MLDLSKIYNRISAARVKIPNHPSPWLKEALSRAKPKRFSIVDRCSFARVPTRLYVPKMAIAERVKG